MRRRKKVLARPIRRFARLLSLWLERYFSIWVRLCAHFLTVKNLHCCNSLTLNSKRYCDFFFIKLLEFFNGFSSIGLCHGMKSFFSVLFLVIFKNYWFHFYELLCMIAQTSILVRHLLRLLVELPLNSRQREKTTKFKKKEVNVMDLIPRADISGSITKTLISELND